MELLVLIIGGVVVLSGLALIHVFSKDQGRRARARDLFQLIVRR